MKKVFTICFALLTFLVTEAQKGSPYIMRYVPYNGSNPTEFSISHIISDYGPRNVPPPMTFWHRGIDISRISKREIKSYLPAMEL